MKIRLFLATLICALVTLPSVQAQDGQAKKGKAPETELGRHMDKMNGALRTLRAQISDASKNADSLAQVAIIKENATAGLKLEPVRKKEVPAADQAKFLSGYRDQLQNLIGLVGKLETALKAGNNADAAKLLDELGAAQKAGHKEYKQQKKKSA
jgi:soluble cytochrome b562